jgi:hypothetical protein
MLYKCSALSIFLLLVFSGRQQTCCRQQAHPAAAVGTPMCGRDPSARSAGDINGIAGRAGCRLLLARYTPCFWLDIRPVFG